MAEPIEILEFEIERYKALSSVRIGWSSRMVLFGPNGSGKTTLLEAFALCFGSQASLWQLARRAEPPRPGSLSAVVRCPRWVLPMPPAAAAPAFAEVTRSGTAFDEYGDDARFWSALGATGASANWEAAIRETVDDAQVAELLVGLGQGPLVRYRLEEVGGLSEAGGIDRAQVDSAGEFRHTGVRFQRMFSRTLVLDGPPPGWLTDRADELPDVFAPLRRWVARPEPDASRFVDLMELPPTAFSPVRCLWMASERTAMEAYFDLWCVWEQSFEEIALLTGAVGRLTQLGLPQLSMDAVDYWLLSEIASRLGETVSMVSNEFACYANDSYLDQLYVGFDGRDHPASDPFVFERFGSAERVWLDIGLANAAAATEDLIDQARIIRTTLERLNEGRIVELGIDVEQDVVGGHSPYLSPFDLARRVLQLPEAAVGAPDEAVPVSMLVERLGIKMSTLRVDIFDEPERHLHPQAQRRLARILGNVDDRDVVLATHSQLFLARTGWQHLYVARQPDGPKVTPFEPGRLDAAASISQEMGLDRGELLSMVSYVLYVEGPIDKIVLEELFGETLQRVGVLVLPIHGVDEALALAETELIGTLVHVGVGVLVDHARHERLATLTHDTARTKEEHVVVDLKQRCRRRGRDLDLFGLQSEDIIAYLDDTIIKEAFPSFPGWDRFKRQPGERFKEALTRLCGGHVGRKAVRDITRRMKDRSVASRGDLAALVEQVVVAASRTTSDA